MLKIKLVRIGKKNQPFYRIVVIPGRKKINGNFLELLGYYDPTKNPYLIKIDKQRYEYWLEKGAQPSNRVRFLVKGIK